MVGIFTGLGAGFERGSGASLGGVGLLGGGTLGRSGERVFVNAATGNLVISQRDEFLIGRGPDAEVARTYNSFGALDENGDHWRQSTDRRVFGLTGTVNTAGSAIKRVSADGSEITYHWTGSHYQTTDGAGAHDRLTYNGSVWTWTDGDSQWTETYAAYGADNWRITAQSDRSGNTLSFTYTGDKLTRVTTADGAYIEYSWSGNNITQMVTGYTDLATSTAQTLTRTRYGYDGSNRLTSVTVDLTPEDNSVSDGNVYTTTYTYHGTSKRIATIAQTDGSLLAIQYDGSGRVTQLTQTVAGGDTRVTGFAYGAGTTSVTDPRGQVTKLYYDAAGQLTGVEAPVPHTGAAASAVQFAYDGAGNLVSITDAAGGVTQYRHDGQGNVTYVRHPNGSTTLRVYDLNNNKLIQEIRTGASITLPASSPSGVTVSGAHITAGLGDASAVHAQYVYDASGRLRYAISGAGHVTEYRYTAAGQLQFEITYPDHVYATASNLPTLAQMDSWRNGLADRSTTQIFEYRYDARGNIMETVNWGAATPAGGTSNAEGYAHQFFIYDQSGQLLSRRTSPDSFSETFVYDGLGRLVASTDLNGGTTSIAFQDAATTTVITTGAGHVVTSVYNKAGNLISQTDSGSDSASTAEASYLYDKNGQVRRTAMRTGRTGDERIDYTYHLYDKAGRKIADINHIGEVAEYRYDAAGRVVATVRYTNRLTAAQITSLGNPNSEIELASIRPANHSYDIWQWTIYDTGGRVIRTILGDGSVTRYSYDHAGRLIATFGYFNKIAVSSYMNGTSLGPVWNESVPAAHVNDTTTRTFYDSDGRIIGALNGEGHLSRIVYDNAGRRIEETVYANPTNASLRASGTYQQLWNSVTKDSAKDITSRYVYDGQGLLRFAIDALNRVTEYVYFGSSVSHANGVVRSTVQYAAPLGSLPSYTYASVKAAVAGLASAANDRSAWNIYNARGQLSYTIDASGAVTGFTYDIAGRVTKAVQYGVLRATSSLPTIGTMDSWAAANGANARITRSYYSTRGEVLATVDAEGYVTRNWYDAQGRIWDSRRYELAVSANDAWTISNVDGANKGTFARTQYRYDRDGNLVDVYAPDGTRSNFGRYATGRQAWETTALGQGADEVRILLIYDQAGRVREKRYFTAETYVDGNSAHVKELFTYDGFGNLATATDPNGTVTSYTYDKLGRVLTETRAFGQPEAATTTYQYDAFGRIVKVTDARGNASFSYYDQASRVVRTVDAENYLNLTDYTAFGEVASVTRRYNKVSGTPNVTTPPALPAAHALDATASYTYDKLGRLLRATDALGAYDEYTYSAFGSALTHRNKLGGTTSYQYDKLGRRTQETLPALVHNSAGTQVATTIVNTFAYDSRGNLTTKTEASGRPEQRVTTYTYDAASRLTKVSAGTLSYYASGTVAGTTSDEVAETLVYDRRGNVIEQTDASGTKTLTWYDKLDRVTHQLVQQNGTQAALTRNFYDANGNVTEARVYATLVTLPANATGAAPAGSGSYRVTTFTWDRLNRMLTSTVPSIQTAAYTTSLSVVTGDLTTSYLYDAVGNVVRITDPNGGQVHSYYDKLGRKTHEVDQEKYITAWEYNAQGNVTRERRYAQAVGGTVSTSSYGTITNNYPLAAPADALNQSYQDRVTDYTYDRLGRKLTEIRQGVLVFNGTNGFSVLGSIVSFTYNGLGQVLTKTEAADAGTGATNTYAYDTIGRLTLESRKAFTDFNGNSATPTVDYYYDALGNLVRQRERGTTGAAERAMLYTYGAGGRLSSVTDAEGFVRTYRYDKGGRIVREEYTRVLGTTGSLQEGIVYHYDAQGRITEQFVAERAGNGAYTAAANDQRSQSQYNAFGEVSARGINGVYAEQFRYDNAGRLIATSAGDGIWKYFLYDRNGNQTLAITSSGMNIQDQSMSWVLGRWANTGAIATAHVAGINATITRYDGRGLATEVREPQRERSSGARETYLTSRQYNAFGDVVSETNALGHTVDYKHNTMGRLIRTESPQVNVTGENGATTAQRPTEFYYYDRSGRLVASRDANGNLTRQTLLAGTGYGGTEALVTQTIHADGGIVNTAYDIHGNARRVTDQLNRQTTQTFDRMGRLTNIGHAGGLSETFAYDGLGQQMQRWNSQLGASVKETTLYDRQGRIQTHIAMGGDTTSYAYSWSSSYATTGAGTFGGWQTVTTYANTKTLTVQEDQFGRTIYKNDLGSNVSTFSYNAAGNLTGQAITPASGTGLTLGYTYFNTGKLATQLRGTLVNEYAYDRAGNLTGEVLKNGATTLSSQTSTYDALGRMLTWSEAGSATLPASSITWKYDANGNIRNSETTAQTLNSQGGIAGPSFVSHWYLFDTMNRVVRDKGLLIDGQIKRGMTGVDLAYDLAGQRTSSTRTNMSGDFFSGFYVSAEKETYIYNAAGALTDVYIAYGTPQAHTFGDLAPNPPAPTGTGTRRATFIYDAMGRQTRQTDYDTNGTTALFDQYTQYNSKSQIELQDNFYKRSDGVYLTRNWHYYAQSNYLDAFNWTNYALGAVTHLLTQNFKKDAAVTPLSGSIPANSIQNASATTTTYDWYDSAAQKQIVFLENVNSQGGPLGGTVARTTTHTSDAAGILLSASIADGRPRTVTYTSTAAGQTVRRSEADNQPSNGDPHEVWYRFGGKELGYTGNNGTLETSYTASINNRMALSSGTGAFRNGAATGIAHTAFDPSLARVNSYNQGSSSGGYTVRAGETLGSIAANLWGDSALWYKLAQANGLSGEAALAEGQSLRIPAGVMKNTHNAATYRPYDPAETIGDTAPTTPKPPKKNKCGVFGQVMLVVIAVAVTLITYNPAGSAGLLNSFAAKGLAAKVTAGAAAGAAGSAASQAVGVATGIQDKFSWNAVAQAGIGGGVGASGFGGAMASGASGRMAQFISGAASNALSQGIGMSAGLQKKFSWAGVAAAGMGDIAFNAAIGPSQSAFAGFGNTAGAIAARTAAGTASAIADAAPRTALGSGNFGDNFRAAIPNIIGQALGSVVGEKATSLANRLARHANSGEAVPPDNSLFADGTFGDRVIQQMLERGGSAQDIETAKGNPDFRRWIDGWRSAELAATGVATAGDPYYIDGADVFSGGSNDFDRQTAGLAGMARDISGNLIDASYGFVEFADKHPRIAEIGVGAIQAAVSGGPTIKVLKTLGGSMVDSELSRAAEFIGGQTTGLLQNQLGFHPLAAEVGGLGVDTAATLALGAGFKEVLSKSKKLTSSADSIMQMGLGGDLIKGGTYKLKHPGTGQTMRNGRTKDLHRRRLEHARDPDLKDYRFETTHRTDDYAVQRGLEKMQVDLDRGPLDKIQPLSPRNPNAASYEKAAEDFLKGKK